MVHTGRLQSLCHPIHAEIAELGGNGHIFYDPLAIDVVGTLHNANAPLIQFQVMFLFAGHLTGMATAAPGIIDIESVFHRRLSF
jgi:hypothetical protein